MMPHYDFQPVQFIFSVYFHYVRITFLKIVLSAEWHLTQGSVGSVVLISSDVPQVLPVEPGSSFDFFSCFTISFIQPAEGHEKALPDVAIECQAEMRPNVVVKALVGLNMIRA